MPERLALGAEPRGPDGELVADHDGFRAVGSVIAGGQLDGPEPGILNSSPDARGLRRVRFAPGRPERVDQTRPVLGLLELGLGDPHALKVVFRFDDALISMDLKVQRLPCGSCSLLGPDQRRRREINDPGPVRCTLGEVVGEGLRHFPAQL